MRICCAMRYLLRKKSEIFEAVQDVPFEVAPAGLTHTALRGHDALGFRSSAIYNLLKKHLVKNQYSTPYVPAENNRDERQNRSIMESARAMLEAASLPKVLWGEVAKAVCHIRNQIPFQRLD